jgi:hypothetical protein
MTTSEGKGKNELSRNINAKIPGYPRLDTVSTINVIICWNIFYL